jgi:predicted lipoprotein with Yx(FWY)xxD motif
VTRHIRQAMLVGALGIFALTACSPAVGTKGSYGGEAAPAANQDNAAPGADGDYGDASSAPPAAPAPEQPSTAPSTLPTPAAQPNALIARTIPKMGQVVTDSKGHVLYRFDLDRAEPTPRSNCTGKCLTAWPAVVTSGNPNLVGVDPAIVGTVTRADGRKQLTIDGWPVYWFAKDPKPGAWRGQGVNGTWWVISPSGKRNLTCVPAGVTPPRQA